MTAPHATSIVSKSTTVTLICLLVCTDVIRDRRMFSAELPQEIRHQWRRFGEKAEIKEKVLDKIGKTSSSKGRPSVFSPGSLDQK